MKKYTVCIDKNYPRRFGANDEMSELIDSNLNPVLNWTFSDGLSADNPTAIPDVTNINEVYNEGHATNEQVSNLEQNRIDFSANVFNYIVHTTFQNVLLKYDSAVIYNLVNWQDAVVVADINNLDYQIFFDILMYDPVGIDAYAYEALVRNTKFAEVKRNNDGLVEDKRLAVKWTDDNTAENVDIGSISKDDIYMYEGTLSDNVRQGSTDLIVKFTQLPDKYNNNHSYRMHIAFAGRNFDENYINTSTANYKNWLNVSSDANSSEADIIEAFDACEGIKYKFYDVAGNITYWVMPHLKINVVTLDDIKDLKKLQLTFIDTHPEDMILSEDIIGRTTVKVYNPNQKFADYPINIYLEKKSIGHLYPTTYQLHSEKISDNFTYTYVTELVDNIVESGWVIASAELQLFNWTGALAKYVNFIISQTKVTGSLGEWIKECNDNTRKLTLDPFVPQYLKDTTNKNSAYYKFVKFTENYLNTMYKAYNKECYISVLEVIARMYNFNDVYQIYDNLLTKYDDDHGDMLHIDMSELSKLIEIDKQME